MAGSKERCARTKPLARWARIAPVRCLHVRVWRGAPHCHGLLASAFFIPGRVGSKKTPIWGPKNIPFGVNKQPLWTPCGAKKQHFLCHRRAPLLAQGASRVRCSQLNRFFLEETTWQGDSYVHAGHLGDAVRHCTFLCPLHMGGVDRTPLDPPGAPQMGG